MSVIQAPGGERLLTLDEAAERLGVSRARVYELVGVGDELGKGELKSVQLGRLRRIVESDLVAYIESLRAAS